MVGYSVAIPGGNRKIHEGLEGQINVRLCYYSNSWTICSSSLRKLIITKFTEHQLCAEYLTHTSLNLARIHQEIMYGTHLTDVKEIQ